MLDKKMKEEGFNGKLSLIKNFVLSNDIMVEDHQQKCHSAQGQNHNVQIFDDEEDEI